MRWTDLPPERGPADAGAPALSRGKWEELRQRLERLPPGHPSRPDGEGEAGADGDSSPAEPSGEPGADPDAGRRAGDEEGHLRREPTAGRAGPVGHGDLAKADGREPYRPWFTAGESPEPWFAADPD
jgi:hypothetical protein